jgi:serine/alanine adding enzyme
MSLRFLSVAEAAATDLPWPDLYFSPGYGAAVEASDDAVWEVAVWDRGPILQPMLRRPVDPSLAGAGLFDLVSPYGYAGAWAPADVPAAEWSAFRAACRSAAIDRGAVAEFLRIGALVPGGDALIASDVDLRTEHLQDTVVLDLSIGYDAWWTAAQGRCRTSIRKARKVGWTAEARPVVAADFEPESPFRSLYEDTMRRVGASTYYLFGDAYYDRLRAACGDDLWLVEARRGDEVGAAALFVRWNDLLHYHLSGSGRDAAREGANNLMLDAALKRGIDAGVTRFHLGGGVGGEDALFKFKASFGGSRIPFRVGRAVLDPVRYDALTAARATATSRSVAELMSSGYFPAYRA